MQKLLTTLILLVMAATNVAYGTELLKVARIAARIDPLMEETQAEDIAISALKKPTTPASVKLSTHVSSENAEGNISDASEKNKAAATAKETPNMIPSKQPAVFTAPFPPFTTKKPTWPTSWPTSTTKKPRRTTTTRRPRPDIDTNTPVDCNSDIEFWPHPHCNKYIWCINGEKTVHTCNDGLYWNYKLERCGWPNRVPKDHCRIPPAVVSVTTLTTTTPVPYRDCSENEFHSHPDCDKFIRCVDGEPQTFHCPGGLYWDNENEICEWPKNVSQDNCNAPVKKNL